MLNKMLPQKTLQRKLLVSVFIIVSLTILSITAVVTIILKKQFQQAELSRIYYETDALKKRLGHLMYGKNFRYLMITLSNAKKANSSILYFVLTDSNGKILIADNERIIGQISENKIAGKLSKAAHIDGVLELGEGSVVLPGVYIEGNL